MTDLDDVILLGPEDIDRGYESPLVTYERIAPEQLEADRAGYLDLLAAVIGKARAESSDPFFWRAVVSTNRLDSHGTMMGRTSLKNYADDAKGGVSFLIGHNRQAAPVGYSLDGKFIAGQNGGTPRTEALFYSMRGTPDNDTVIAKLEDGLLRDHSIGFGGRDQRWICSIDGQDLLRASWEECGHFPGVYYKKDGGSRRGAKKEELVLCTATVEDAHMFEVSGVYKGSTPGAGVLKAQRAAEMGLLTGEQRAQLEVQYRISLPDRAVSVPVAGVPDPEETVGDRTDPVDDTTTRADPAAAVVPPPAAVEPSTDEWSAAVRDLGIDPGGDPLAALRGYKDTIGELRGLADAGRTYRAELIERALVAGVRAMGDTFRRDTWKANLEGTRDIVALKGMCDDLIAAGEKALPNGRTTVDSPAAVITPIQQKRIPMRASRA
jgi:hypothetical protein